MTTTDRHHRTHTSRKWFMLALGMLAQTAGAVFINGAAFLIPALHDDRGLSLASAGLLVAMPTVGIMLTLIAWGVLVDRIGERLVLVIGLGLTALFSFAAVFTTSFLLLGLCLLAGGMAAASANSASGRVVVGWFPPERRGLAMGIRQMSVPLGVAIAALTIPSIARDHGVSASPEVSCAWPSSIPHDRAGQQLQRRVYSRTRIGRAVNCGESTRRLSCSSSPSTSYGPTHWCG
jgi:sugar phosphate permease